MQQNRFVISAASSENLVIIIFHFLSPILVIRKAHALKQYITPEQRLCLFGRANRS
jgi:hypothetical protein